MMKIMSRFSPCLSILLLEEVEVELSLNTTESGNLLKYLLNSGKVTLPLWVVGRMVSTV